MKSQRRFAILMISKLHEPLG